MRLAQAVVILLLTATGDAQAQTSRTIEVTEPFGMRRTEFPVSTHIDVAQGVLPDVAHARLRTVDPPADVPAQFTASQMWDDGTVRGLDVDFNVTIGPGESRRYALEYGRDTAAGPAGRGLAVTDEADAVQVGTLRFGKRGAPLVLSANYRGEFIGAGLNTVTIAAGSGQRLELSAAQGLAVALVKRGPLNVVLRYSGRMPLDAAYSVPFTIDFEMPNSKSWFKMTAAVDDPARRVSEVALHLPLGYAAHPWTWDFGTDSGSYGALRAAADSVVFTQTVNVKGATGWEVKTSGAQGAPRTYESSAPRPAKLASGWGHLVDANRATAFAIDGFARSAGTYTVSANGAGQTMFAFAPAQPAVRHQFVIYQHFVTTPVPIGAATSPASILNPLRVTLLR